MIEIIIVIALILLIRFWVNPSKKKRISAIEKEKRWNRKNPEYIIGKSTFVLSAQKQKQAQIEKQKEPVPESSGKMDVEIPLDYEPDNELQEEQEELQRLGLQTDYSYNVTPDDIISVINDVGNDQTETIPEIGKLLYENEKTDWVEQLASSSENSTKRIASLIDLHMERLGQPNSNEKLDDGLKGFDIGNYIY